MFARLTCRQLPHLLAVQAHVYPSVRTLVTSSRSVAPSSRLARAGLGLATAGVLTASLTFCNVWGTAHADAAAPEADKPSAATVERLKAPLSSLMRSYIVYSMCSIPTLIDWAPTLLDAFTAVPCLKQLTEAIVRITFFDQFVGGDTAEDCLPLLEQLRAEGKGSLFAYSVEVDENEASGGSKEKAAAMELTVRQIVAETLHCINVAADFEDKHTMGLLGVRGRKTWVAIKLTAMLPHAETLYKFSKYLIATRPPSSPTIAFPGEPLPMDLDVLSTRQPTNGLLTQADIADLIQLRDDLRAICKKAQERGVRIIMDAEYSWYQPAVDAYLLALQREFNKLPRRSSYWSRFSPPAPATVQPLIYQTYQAYLRRTPEYLRRSLAAARTEGYALGAKVVRGAYHPHELAAHMPATVSSTTSVEDLGDAHRLSISPDPEPPVWLTKAETDKRYDECTAVLLEEVSKDMKARREAATVGVLFGTHNSGSVDRILERMEKLGLAKLKDDGRLWLTEGTTERVALGQLYGMMDMLTNSIVERTNSASPFVLKYIPYGALSEVMPYLSRRAIENKSVLGNGAAETERKAAAAEIWKRIIG